MQPVSFRAALAILATTTLSACDANSIGPVASPPDMEGVWRVSEPGVMETTLSLSASGAARLVGADLARLVCTSYTGTWTVDGGTLVLRLQPPDAGSPDEVRSFTYDVSEGALMLTAGGRSTTYAAAADMPSCLSYGFGSWQGTLSARINDVPWAFTNVSVETGGIGAGRLEILACLDTASSCEAEEAVLRLRVSASGPLSPGDYPLGDESSGFYGLVNPFPDHPSFPGFDSLRLLPTGAFTLTSVAEERVTATFEFRANARATNAPPAPDGSTFALVTLGMVDLTYR